MDFLEYLNNESRIPSGEVLSSSFRTFVKTKIQEMKTEAETNGTKVDKLFVKWLKHVLKENA